MASVKVDDFTNAEILDCVKAMRRFSKASAANELHSPDENARNDKLSYC